MHRFKCCCRKELWDDVIFFPLVKDGPVFPILKAIRKLLSLVFREFDQLSSWLPLRYFRVILTTKRLFNRNQVFIKLLLLLLLSVFLAAGIFSDLTLMQSGFNPLKTPTLQTHKLYYLHLCFWTSDRKL